MGMQDCLRCQQPFQARKRFARYCLPCRAALEYERKKRHRQEHQPEFRATGFSCAICGKIFEPLTRREKYCGDECYQEARRRQAKTPKQRARKAKNKAAQRERSPERLRQLVRESRVRHRDKRLEGTREWYRQHPGYRAEASRKWRALHPGQKRWEGMEYYRANKDKVSARVRAYRQAHPELLQRANSRRRARLLAAVGDWTRAQFLELCEACDWRCAYCHQRFERLTPDHIQPLSRGGSNDISNIIPACGPCNYSKQDKTPLEYLTRFTPSTAA